MRGRFLYVLPFPSCEVLTSRFTNRWFVRQRWQDYLAQFQPDKSGPSSQPWSAPFLSSSSPNKLYPPPPSSSKSIWSRIFSRRQEREPRLPGSFDSFESEGVGEVDPLKLKISDLDAPHYPTDDHYRPRPYTFPAGQLTAEPDSMQEYEDSAPPAPQRPAMHSLPTSGSQTSLPYLRPDARGNADSPYDQARKAQLSAPPRVFTGTRIPEPSRAETRPRARKMSSGGSRMDVRNRASAPARPALDANKNQSETSLALSGETVAESTDPREERNESEGKGKRMGKEDNADEDESSVEARSVSVSVVVDHERSSPLSDLANANVASRLSPPASRRSSSGPVSIPVSLRPGVARSPENPHLRPPQSSPQRPRFSLAHSSAGSASSASLVSSRSGSSRLREVQVIPEEPVEDLTPNAGQLSLPVEEGSHRGKEHSKEEESNEDGPNPSASLIRALERIRRPDALAHLPSPHLPTQSQSQSQPRPRADSHPIPLPRATTPRPSSPHPRAPGASTPLFEPDEWDAFFSDVRSRAAVPRHAQLGGPGMNMRMGVGA